MAVVDDERRVELGSRQFANNPKTIPQPPEGAGIRRLLPSSSEEIDQSFAHCLRKARTFRTCTSKKTLADLFWGNWSICTFEHRWLCSGRLAVQKQSCLSHNEKTFSAIFFASSSVQLFYKKNPRSFMHRHIRNWFLKMVLYVKRCACIQDFFSLNAYFQCTFAELKFCISEFKCTLLAESSS